VNFRKIAPNFILMLGTFVFCLLLGELLFPFFLAKIPLKFHGYVDRGLLALVQSSKKSVIPKNYNAIFGDSYAAGLGEWLNKEREKNSYFNPDYGPAHILHNKLGKDVVSFGSGGTGSIEGLVSLPIAQLEAINSYLAFNLDKPKQILAFFFEGNDIEDNLRDLDRFFKPKYDMSKVYEKEYFQEFLKNEIVKNHPLTEITENATIYKNLIFSKFLGRGILDLFSGILSEENSYEKKWKILTEKEKLYQLDLNNIKPDLLADRHKLINIALVDNKKWVFNNRNMGAQTHISGEKIRLGVYVFEQSLMFMHKYFSDSNINIVYLPSTLSSYRLLTAEESGLKNFGGIRADYNLRLFLIRQRSEFICNQIERIAKRNKLGFLDAGKYIRRKTKTEILHGSIDQDHFNKKGYTVLSEAIIDTFYSNDEQVDRGRCEYTF
jgi:hypothetical protein